MKKSTLRSGLLFLVLGPILLASPIAMAGQGSVLDRIHEADQPFDNLKIETVHQLSVKTIRAQELYQGGTFRVLARKDAIDRFRCSACHTDKPARARNGALFSHDDITINHGKDENELACSDCHHQKDRDALHDKQGRKIDYDHSYQLCGQCHFRQKRDWLGGAHGKRETYWAGERVVRNCTSCHDPHSPAFKTKMPETYSLPLDD